MADVFCVFSFIILLGKQQQIGNCSERVGFTFHMQICKARWGDVVDRLMFYAPYKADPERWHKVMDELRAA